ncbi:aldehyde dehydrogenase family protein [Mesorhizobium sp. CAU 1732]|uniref:aldehyde dehydrogenase family protein n=1 Tax=Mesorhizobium sp. CAU 1732 TaxID=3140358 RepID=UPI003261383C
MAASGHRRSPAVVVVIHEASSFELAAHRKSTSNSPARTERRLSRVHSFASGVSNVDASNSTAATPDLPFGGYKQSGNGSEFGIYGLEEFLEVKAVIGVTD